MYVNDDDVPPPASSSSILYEECIMSELLCCSFLPFCFGMGLKFETSNVVKDVMAVINLMLINDICYSMS